MTRGKKEIPEYNGMGREEVCDDLGGKGGREA